MATAWDEGLVRGSPGGGTGSGMGGCLVMAMKSLLTAHLAVLPLMLGAPTPVYAQPQPQQPLAVPPLSSTPWLPGAACKRLVPLKDSVLQPLRIEPRQVPRKNAGGCLSAADAVYSADGCPLRLCPRAVPSLEL